MNASVSRLSAEDRAHFCFELQPNGEMKMRVDTTAANGNYMKVSEVARELGITGFTVRALVKKGDIKPALRVGNLVLIPREAFNSYVEQATIRPATAAA